MKMAVQRSHHGGEIVVAWNDTVQSPPPFPLSLSVMGVDGNTARVFMTPQDARTLSDTLTFYAMQAEEAAQR